MNVANRLLNSLSAEDREKIVPRLEPVTYKLNDILIKPGETIKHVVFPETCLASLVTVLEDGSTVEGGSVGFEGMAGIPVLLDADTTPMETLIQVPGEAFRIDASVARELYRSLPTFRAMANRYVHTIFVVASQSAACNRKHQVVDRLARWLLMSADGIRRDDIEITHEFLASMLGVRRSGVTEALQVLQEQKLVDTHRGSVTIIDRPRLETTSCECYRIVTREFNRIYS